MSTVAQPSGEARDSVLSMHEQRVYQEGRKAGVVLAAEVCKILAKRFVNPKELGERVREVIDAIWVRNQPFTLQVVKQLLEEWAKPKLKSIPPREVLTAVAEHFGIGVPDLQGPARDAYTSLARQAAMLLLRDLSGLSSTKVGERLYRDHSTVLWGQKTAEERRGGEPRFWQDLEEIKASLLRA